MSNRFWESRAKLTNSSLIKKARRIFSAPSGFTLIEMVIALGLITVATGIIGSALFRVTSIQRFWTDDMVATKSLRHIGSWFSGDALNAQDVVDSGGVLRLTCNPDSLEREVTLKWTSIDGTAHSANYAVAQDTLVRTVDGAKIILANQVIANSVSFTLCGEFLTLAVDVKADRNTTETLNLRTKIRKLQPGD